jgi:hypothetical protein
MRDDSRCAFAGERFYITLVSVRVNVWEWNIMDFAVLARGQALFFRPVFAWVVCEVYKHFGNPPFSFKTGMLHSIYRHETVILVLHGILSCLPTRMRFFSDQEVNLNHHEFQPHRLQFFPGSYLKPLSR